MEEPGLLDRNVALHDRSAAFALQQFDELLNDERNAEAARLADDPATPPR